MHARDVAKAGCHQRLEGADATHRVDGYCAVAAVRCDSDYIIWLEDAAESTAPALVRAAINHPFNPFADAYVHGDVWTANHLKGKKCRQQTRVCGRTTHITQSL